MGPCQTCYIFANLDKINNKDFIHGHIGLLNIFSYQYMQNACPFKISAGALFGAS